MAEAILITRKQAAEVLSISLRQIDYLLESGKLGSIYIGTSRRIALSDVRALAATGTK